MGGAPDERSEVLMVDATGRPTEVLRADAGPRAAPAEQLRILAILGALTGTGGMQRYYADLIPALAGRGHTIVLLHQDDGDLGAPWAEATSARRRVRIYRLRPRPRAVARWPVDAVRAVRFGTRHRPDVVYASRHSQLLPAVAVGRRSGVPVVCHLHDPPPRARMPSRYLAVMHRCDRFIAVSSFVAERWVDSGLRSEGLEVIHNGVDVTRFRPGDGAERDRIRAELGIPPGAFVVLYSGRLDRAKGVGVLLRAWRDLGLPPDRGRLLITGAPSRFRTGEANRSLMDELRRTADPATTVWLGHVPDLVPVMWAADVVAVPSLWEEPFGLVVIEALACGRPVVASRVGGITETLTGAFADHLVAAGDVAELAAKLGELEGWQVRRPSLGEECRRHALERFTFDRVLTAVEGVLHYAVERNRGARRRAASP